MATERRGQACWKLRWVKPGLGSGRKLLTHPTRQGTLTISQGVGFADASDDLGAYKRSQQHPQSSWIGLDSKEPGQCSTASDPDDTASDLITAVRDDVKPLQTGCSGQPMHVADLQPEAGHACSQQRRRSAGTRWTPRQRRRSACP